MRVTMRVTTMLFMLAGGAIPALFAAEPVLMPLPVKVQATPGKFAINANFVVETVGGANARLAPAVRWFLARVSRQTGVLYAPVPPAASDARRLAIDCAGRSIRLLARMNLTPWMSPARRPASRPRPRKALSTGWQRSLN